jgi:hypothetical protein
LTFRSELVPPAVMPDVADQHGGDVQLASATAEAVEERMLLPVQPASLGLDGVGGDLDDLQMRAARPRALELLIAQRIR